MKTVVANRTGNSGAEERFIQLFCDVFGPERGQYVYMQHPFVDIYGGHRTIDFALHSSEGRIAIEIDGNQWHQPSKISEDKYHDDGEAFIIMTCPLSTPSMKILWSPAAEAVLIV